MRGILKIYHPEETLKYSIKQTYCKAVYSNEEYFLEVEIITDDGLDHVEDDSLQYHFPQLSIQVFDFPIDSSQLSGQTFSVNDSEEETFTEVDLFDDDEAYTLDNQLSFKEDENGELRLEWEGKINDFYMGSDDLIPFKIECDFVQEPIEIADEE